MEGTVSLFAVVAFIMPLTLGCLGIYVLILLIKASKIYINKNSKIVS